MKRAGVRSPSYTDKNGNKDNDYIAGELHRETVAKLKIQLSSHEVEVRNWVEKYDKLVKEKV